MSGDSRRRLRAASRTACSAVVLAAAGCGGNGGPRLDQDVAAPLRALAHRVATEPPCPERRDIARLRARVIGAVNRHRVTQELQEPLASGVAALAELAPRCRRGAPTPPTSAPPPLLAAHGEVAPVPHAATAAQEARNLEEWLRRYSR